MEAYSGMEKIKGGSMTPHELRQLRLSLGWSQAALAKELGVHTQTVAHWEQGLYAICGMA